MRVSIAIVNFNRADFLRRAIRSAQNQIRLGFDLEIIVVDDHSFDQSREIIKEFAKFLKIRFLDSNLGVGNASQEALEMSTGDYFLRLDSDDFLSPLSIVALFTGLEADQDFHYAYGDHYRVDEQEKRVSLVKLDKFENLVRHGAGILFRTEILKSEGGYNRGLRHGEDTDLIYRLFQKEYRGLYIPLPLYRYHIHGSNLSLQPHQVRAQDELRKKYGI